MAWNGRFFNGVWSCGFDMDPVTAELFDIAGSSGSAITTGTPFGSGRCWQVNGTAGRSFGVNLTTFIFGVRVFTAALPGTSGILFDIRDVTANASQVTLRVFADGSLRFYLGNGTGTPLGSASATGLIPLSVWTYVECKVVINATTGSVECRINGNTSPVISAGSLNTKSTANLWVSGLTLTSLSGNASFDDYYWADTTGASPLDTYHGNIRVVGDVASGAGAHAQFTPTNPTNVNYSNTANIPADTSKYNSDGTPGDIDSYAFPTIGGGPASVLYINHWYKMELDTAGARTVVPGCRSGGADFFDTTAQTPPNGSYQYFNKPWTVDPNTSAAWTVANAQSAELSTKINT